MQAMRTRLDGLVQRREREIERGREREREIERERGKERKREAEMETARGRERVCVCLFVPEKIGWHQEEYAMLRVCRRVRAN